MPRQPRQSRDHKKPQRQESPAPLRKRIIYPEVTWEIEPVTEADSFFLVAKLNAPWERHDFVVHNESLTPLIEALTAYRATLTGLEVVESTLTNPNHRSTQ
jgi:hypothetical protein